MMDFNERVIPGVSANFLFQEALARYVFANKRIKHGSFLLDVGCGTGYGANLLSRKASVVGLDINKEAIKYAQNKFGKRVRFRVGNAEKLTVAEKFDTVCAFEVIEHLKNPNKFLGNVKSSLYEGGLFILSTPNKAYTQKGTVSSPYHFKEYTYLELLNLLAKHFKKVEIYGQGKSRKANIAFRDFMRSQDTRQDFVKRDIFGIRGFLPKPLKEGIWRYLGGFFGRSTQENLGIKDFPITRKEVARAYYFIAVCGK